MDYVSYVLAVSRGDAAAGVVMSVCNSLYCFPMQAFGTEEQKNVPLNSRKASLPERQKQREGFLYARGDTGPGGWRFKQMLAPSERAFALTIGG